jgi:phosphatidylcholine synthase
MNEAAEDSEPAPARIRARAFAVHIFTALGAGIALVALLAAVHQQWAAMFGWLGVALLIDGLDGSLARRLDVIRVLPNWSGDTLDMVVDFTTYVFVPAYVIAASDLLLPGLATWLGVAVVISGALYFADRRMKTEDNHFRGFPALWNLAVFYLFLLRPAPLVATAAIAVLVLATFLPIRVIHPMRVVRLRILNIVLVVVWAVLATAAIISDFDVAASVSVALCLIGIYFVASDGIIRTLTRTPA